MSERPAPPPEFPPGQAIAVPDPKWTVDNSGRHCRFLAGPRTTACGAPSVAAMNRGRWNRRLRTYVDWWWSYCGDHMYGRWIEDGQVMHWIRKPEEDA